MNNGMVPGVVRKASFMICDPNSSASSVVSNDGAYLSTPPSEAIVRSGSYKQSSFV